MRPPLLAVIVLLILARPGLAQEPDDTNRVWLTGGLGAGWLGDTGLNAAMGQLVVQRDAHHVAVRGVWLTEVATGGTASGTEAGILYGRVLRGSAGHLSLAAGLSAIRCRDPFDPGACDGGTSVGLPLSGEAVLRLGPVLGIGAQAFGNLNPRRSFAGLLLAVQLGWNPS